MHVYTHGKFSEYTHTQVTNAMSTVYTTLDYEYRHKNKGTNLDLVPKKGGVYYCANISGGLDPQLYFPSHDWLRP